MHDDGRFTINSHSVKDGNTKSEAVSAPWLKTDTRLVDVASRRLHFFLLSVVYQAGSWLIVCRCMMMMQGSLVCADVASKTVFVSNILDDDVVFENRAVGHCSVGFTFFRVNRYYFHVFVDGNVADLAVRSVGHLRGCKQHAGDQNETLNCYTEG